MLTLTINFTHQYVTFKQSTVPCYKNNADHSKSLLQINLFIQLEAQAREKFAEKMTSTYKLTYFDIRGKAEPARLVFAQVGVPYEDIRIRQDKWTEMKPSTCVLPRSVTFEVTCSLMLLLQYNSPLYLVAVMSSNGLCTK